MNTADSSHRQEVQIDFTMCNPPFYSSREEILASADAKETRNREKVVVSICILVTALRVPKLESGEIYRRYIRPVSDPVDL